MKSKKIDSGFLDFYVDKRVKVYIIINNTHPTSLYEYYQYVASEDE